MSTRRKVLLAVPIVVLVYAGLSALMTVAFDRWSTSHGLLVQDRETLWRPRPGFVGPPGFIWDGDSSLTPVTIDEQGFRTAGTRASALAPSEIVLAIGDSFTFGWDVADGDSYPAQLQALLDQRAPGRFTVINGGMPGCTSFQAKQLLRRWLPRYRPAVVVAMLGRNDGRKQPLSDSEVQAILRWKPDLLNYVFPFMLLHYRGVQGVAQMRGNSRVQRVSNEEFRHNIQTIVELTRSAGARLILMEHWKRNPAFRLARLAADRGVAYIDTPALVAPAARGGRELFIRTHHHPNRDGYAVIAGALADEILSDR